MGYAAPRGLCFILANDAERLCSTIVPQYGDYGAEVHFAFIICWFYDLRARPSRIPVASLALRRRDRGPIVFSYRGLVCSFTTAHSPFDRSKAFSGYEVRMH